MSKKNKAEAVAALWRLSDHVAREAREARKVLASSDHLAKHVEELEGVAARHPVKIEWSNIRDLALRASSDKSMQDDLREIAKNII